MGSPAAVKRYLKHFPSNMTELYTYFMHIFYKLLRFQKNGTEKDKAMYQNAHGSTLLHSTT